jgi:hypothetical protein
VAVFQRGTRRLFLVQKIFFGNIQKRNEDVQPMQKHQDRSITTKASRLNLEMLELCSDAPKSAILCVLAELAGGHEQAAMLIAVDVHMVIFLV